MSDYSVLIVGAGPTGMELAAELERHGISFLTIDKRESYVTTSNAAGIHARTLECWNKRPWSEAFLKNALKIKGASLHSTQKRLASFDFTGLEYTQYPMILSIPQSETEMILNQHLLERAQPVKRNATLVNIDVQESQVIASFTTPEGTQTVTADWLVGCDGYHSTTRELSKIKFSGKDLSERFILVDADIEADYARDHFHIYLSPQGILAFFPMEKSTRIIAGIGHDPNFKDIEEPTLEIVQQIIKQRSSLTFKMNALKWQSHFWIHEGIARQFKKGRVFIAGDAAHVHSPAGGQGMNTGIQDAYNLAWKLAYTIKGYAPASLLDSYEVERMQIAASVVEMTSRITALAIIRNPLLIGLRNWMMSIVARQNIFQKIMIGRMSELSLHYSRSPIVEGKKIASFSPGERALDVLLDKAKNIFLYDVINDGKFHALIFYSDDFLRNQLVALQKKYQAVLELHFYQQSDVNITQVYDFNKFTICLIRPDQYIGFLGDDIHVFGNYLSRFFIEKGT